MQWAIASGGHSILTPSAASTSAEPEREEIERLPCLATGTPAPATTKAAQVEILCVPLASPPVPQVSMAPSGARTLTARARMARAAPVISSTLSPRARMPISKRADLRLGRAARHDRVEGFGGFGLGEGLARGDLAEALGGDRPASRIPRARG